MARTPEQFLEEMKILHPDIEVVGSYTKAIEPVQVKCRSCGKEWCPKAYSLLSGKSCPHCSAIKGAKKNRGKTGLKDESVFIKQMKDIHPDVRVLSKYKSTHTDVECECLICGKKWVAKPYSLLQNHGCPRCAKSGTSFMEQFIFLSFCNIIGEENVISRDKKTIGMELDIVVPQYNIAVEPGNWFLHKRYLSRDTKKRTCCKEKGYRLITVYDRYPKGKKPPFDYDCYVYSEDLNKADHSIIKELVVSILNTIGIIFDESEIDWAYIEKTAYENARAKTHEVFVREMRTKMPTIEVIGRYVNANRRIKVKCKQCGFEWNAVPANILRGDGCRKCGARVRGSKERRKQEDFENELKKANPTVNVVGTYLSRHKPIEVQCLKCGNVWNATPSSLLRNDQKSENNGCPVCAKHKIGNLRKRVINVDTGEIFESAVEAGKKYNIVSSAIRQCCRGVSNTSNGYHWKYINES